MSINWINSRNFLSYNLTQWRMIVYGITTGESFQEEAELYKNNLQFEL